MCGSGRTSRMASLNTAASGARFALPMPNGRQQKITVQRGAGGNVVLKVKVIGSEREMRSRRRRGSRPRRRARCKSHRAGKDKRSCQLTAQEVRMILWPSWSSTMMMHAMRPKEKLVNKSDGRRLESCSFWSLEREGEGRTDVLKC